MEPKPAMYRPNLGHQGKEEKYLENIEMLLQRTIQRIKWTEKMIQQGCTEMNMRGKEPN